METILEQQRRFHEERERLIDAMTKEKMYQPRTHREKLNSEHRFRHMVDRYLEVTDELKELYEDKDGLRKQDIQALSGPNEFGVFNERLKQIKEFHRKHPGQLAIPLSTEFQEYDRIRDDPEEAAAPIVEFSDEEAYGKYLDLHEAHEKFLNLKGAPKVDYLTFLEIFDRLFDFPREKKNSAYKEYLQVLIDYLESFVSRIKPMYDLNEAYTKVMQQFETQWSEAKFPGWGKEAGSALSYTGAHLDLSAFSSWEELASLGLDRLKSALLALGLKCGGTLKERAQRLWATKGKPLEEINPNFFAKEKANGKAAKSKTKDINAYKIVGEVEARIYHLTEMLGEQRAATRDNVQRRQARTGAEREESEDDDELPSRRWGEGTGGEGDDGVDDDDDNDIPYNPKNLPLGWDGKPIPYWLYKLHGLNMYYTCEICGNQTYRGPKIFLRHFAEWRHAHGMRLLGIPNTAHFANVTKIDEALALWQKIKASKTSKRWNSEQEEEFEDSVGNVVSKKTYEDLKRQDLL